MKRAALFVVCLAAGALPPLAAFSAPSRIHGTMKAFDGQVMTLKDDNGQTVAISVPATVRVLHSRSVAAGDLKPGDFVGTLALKGADNKLRAQAVRVFPDEMDMNGEGQYPWESNPARIVTNGSVTAVSSTGSGYMLSLSFHGAGSEGADGCTGRAPPSGWGCTGTAELSIARGVPIIAVTAGDTALLLPGAIVSVFAETDATGQAGATSITVERDGKPVQ